METFSAAEEVGQHLLQSLDAEDSFELLRSFPGRFSNLLVVDAQREDSQKRLLHELSGVQSRNVVAMDSCLVDASSHMSTLSAAFDTHIDHLQTEADILQAALANPNNVSSSDDLPRRPHGKLLNDLYVEIRSLQETCAQVHEISNYVSTASEQLSQKQELISDLADGILSRDVDTLNGQASDVYHAQIAETHIDNMNILREYISIAEKDLESNKKVIEDQALIIEELIQIREALPMSQECCCTNDSDTSTIYHPPRAAMSAAILSCVMLLFLIFT